jgi:hypothetical protein
LGTVGEGSPAGNCEVTPPGLGSGDGSPDGLGVPTPATPGVTVAGAAGWGTACTEPLDVRAGATRIGAAGWVPGRPGVATWPSADAPASKAKAQATRRARRDVGMVFTA